MIGKVWVACYFFTTCPTICPKMISGMKEVANVYTLNEQFGMISFTVDPVQDTPEKLKAYALARNLPTHQWHLATGRKTDLYRFARKGLMVVATDGDGGPGDFIHSDKLVLIDQESRIRGYYDGTEPSEVKQLTRDVAKLLKK
jgi:protein SCO1/2